jgi:hypothetical protein
MADTTTFAVDPDAAAQAAAGERPYYPETGDAVTDPPEPKPKDPTEDDEESVEEDAESKDDDQGEEQKDEDKDGEGDDEQSDDKDEDKDEAGDENAVPFNDWFTEYTTAGELSAESAEAAMEKVFHPDLPAEMKEQLLRQFLGGIDTGRGMATLGLWGMAGGTQESFDGMVAWANSNLPKAEREAFNAQCDSSPEAQKLAVEGLYARYAQAVGQSDEPSLAHDAASAGGEPAIGSRQELAKIVGSQRYQTDPAYRAKIDRQIGQSLKSGNYRTNG